MIPLPSFFYSHFTREDLLWNISWFSSYFITIGITIFFQKQRNFDVTLILSNRGWALFKNICTRLNVKKKKKNYHDPRSQHFSNAKYFREKIQTRSGSASESSSHGRYLSMRVHSTPFSLTYLFSRTKNNAFKCKNNLPLYARSFTIPYLRRYVARVEYKIHAESRTFFFL